MAHRLADRMWLVVGAAAAVIVLLAIPFVTMAPEQSASTEPGGPIFEARDALNDRFEASAHQLTFIVEARSGDMLAVEPLRALRAAQQGLVSDPEIGPTLLRWFDTDARSEVVGVASVADLIAFELEAAGRSLNTATDADVKDAFGRLSDRLGPDAEALGISTEATQRVDGSWQAPAVVVRVFGDDAVLGFGPFAVNLGADTEPEQYGRDVEALLDTAEGLDVYGIGIGVNLTSQEEGAVAGPFIGATILAALLLVGLTFRSYWVLATVNIAFLWLIVWLKGISNLLGFKDDLVLSLIVPVAMVSFGVDFAFHSLGRYREERERGYDSARAVVVGIGAVSGALLLAMLSDAVAFLANVSAEIESVVQFGIGAAIALVGADVLLGFVVPLVVAWIEQNVSPPAAGRRSVAVRVAGALGAAALTVASVLLMVFLLPWLGFVLMVVTTLVTLVVPVLLARRRTSGPTIGQLPARARTSRFAYAIGQVTRGVASRPILTLAVAVPISVLAALSAQDLPTRFDVEDFFSADTDFVIGLEKLDEHVGSRSGETISVYIEEDLSNPLVLARLIELRDDLRSLERPWLGQRGGVTQINSGVFDVIDMVWASPLMLEQVQTETGVALTDRNGDAIPDSPDQLAALYAVAGDRGVPFDENNLALSPRQVRSLVSLSDVGPDATRFELTLANSQNQGTIAEARAELEPMLLAAQRDLGWPDIRLTGSAVVREASLAATSAALGRSLQIAVLACFAVATVFMRSFRYGFASIIPILMVVAWLYAFMNEAGYAINLVTATIAAVSVGIGIDFALHFAVRFREELGRGGSRHQAAQIAGEGTGTALVASAASSSIGFAILAFAPMPLFATYGLLTSLMVIMALVATLVVLPAVLSLMTHDESRRF